jgi:hypothetical protein
MKKKKTIKKPAPKSKPSSNTDRELREQLVYLLKGGGAHVHFTDGLDDFPAGKYGTFANALPHTGWQLLEHSRIAQRDILEFSRNPKHVSPDFPGGYWPKTPMPPDDKAWHNSVAAFQKDLTDMVRLVQNPISSQKSRMARARRYCAKCWCLRITTLTIWANWWICAVPSAPGQKCSATLLVAFCRTYRG